MSQIALPNLRASPSQALYSGAVDRRHLAPAVEVLAVDHPLGAERQHELALVLLGDDADGIAPRGVDQLDRERAEPARRPPDQHVLPGPQLVRRMAEQHPVGGGQRQRVAGRLLPGQVQRPGHQLLRLHVGELREAAVRRLVAPDPLARRVHRVAAVAVLVVAVVLVAVHDDLVADLPARHLRPDRPDDAGRVRAGDVIGRLVHVERRDRDAEAGPDAVVVDARRQHEHQHLVRIDRRRIDDLDLERLVRLAVALAPDRPGVHLLRHMAERRNLPDLIEFLLRRGVFGLRDGRVERGHGVSFAAQLYCANAARRIHYIIRPYAQLLLCTAADRPSIGGRTAAPW